MSTFSSLTPYDSDEHDNGWDVASSRIEELVRISPPEKTHWDHTTQQLTPCDPPHPEAEDGGSHINGFNDWGIGAALGEKVYRHRPLL